MYTLTFFRSYVAYPGYWNTECRYLTTGGGGEFLSQNYKRFQKCSIALKAYAFKESNCMIRQHNQLMWTLQHHSYALVE